MARELSFSANFAIVHTENFSILENSGGNYKVNGSYNGNIAAYSSVYLQFNGTFASNPEISDVSLTELVVSDTPIDNHDKPYVYTPWLPGGLDVLIAYGAYDPTTESVILEWAYQDNSGDFDIYENDTLIATVSDPHLYTIPVDGETEEYIFTVKKTVSNDVIVRLNEYGFYNFILVDSDEDGLPDLYELLFYRTIRGKRWRVYTHNTVCARIFYVCRARKQ